MTQRLCRFPDCGRQHSAYGLCATHRKQQIDGRPLRPIKPRRRYCTFPDCGRPHESGGLCHAHKLQKLRGRPLKPIREAPPRRRDPRAVAAGEVLERFIEPAPGSKVLLLDILDSARRHAHSPHLRLAKSEGLKQWICRWRPGVEFSNGTQSVAGRRGVALAGWRMKPGTVGAQRIEDHEAIRARRREVKQRAEQLRRERRASRQS